MRVWAWLGRMFEPPVSERHFDRAMAEQTEVIREANAEILAAVKEGHAEILDIVSEMKRAVSELSDDIRVHNEARSSGAVGSAPPEDDPD